MDSHSSAEMLSVSLIKRDDVPASSPKYGGFDLLRIVAALGVVLTHSFELTDHAGDRPMTHIGRFSLAFGNVGVYIFFIISGFLVSSSLDRSRKPSVFLRNRGARIFPGLICVTVLTVFLLGPLMTTLSAGAYLTDTTTISYLLHNSTLLLGVRYYLPGVFSGQGVNGSLWTLPYEVWAYVALLVMAWLGILKRPLLVGGLFAIGVLTFRFGNYEHIIPLRYALFGMNMHDMTTLGTFFLGGAVLSRINSGVRESRHLLVAGFALIAVGFAVREPSLFILGLPAVVVSSGTVTNSLTRRISALGDPSYGIYIASFPLQQTLFHSGTIRTPAAMFLVSAPLSVAAGFASWHLVEKPAMRVLKRRQPIAGENAPPAALGLEQSSRDG